jgi:CheY-like chemotaxis protein
MDLKAKSSQTIRILIIEDDPVAARVYGHHLKKAGYTVLVAQDGPTGVQKLLQLRPNGVLLDIMLPGMSGEEVLKEIRNHKPQLPVVVYTNGFVPMLVDKMVAAGATSVFNKINLTGQELAHAFDKVLRPAAKAAA